MGLKMVNSDVRFEMYLKKAGLSLKMPDSEAAKGTLRARAKQITGGKWTDILESFRFSY